MSTSTSIPNSSSNNNDDEWISEWDYVRIPPSISSSVTRTKRASMASVATATPSTNLEEMDDDAMMMDTSNHGDDQDVAMDYTASDAATDADQAAVSHSGASSWTRLKSSASTDDRILDDSQTDSTAALTQTASLDDGSNSFVLADDYASTNHTSDGGEDVYPLVMMMDEDDGLLRPILDQHQRHGYGNGRASADSTAPFHHTSTLETSSLSIDHLLMGLVDRTDHEYHNEHAYSHDSAPMAAFVETPNSDTDFIFHPMPAAASASVATTRAKQKSGLPPRPVASSPASSHKRHGPISNKSSNNNNRIRHRQHHQYEDMLRNLTESMKRSQSTRKSLKLVTQEIKDHSRKASIKRVLQSIEASSMQIDSHLTRTTTATATKTTDSVSKYNTSSRI